MVATSCLDKRSSKELKMIQNVDESVNQAVHTLFAIKEAASKQKKDLLSLDEEKIFLTLGLKKLPHAKLGYTKVTKIPIPHSIYDSSNSVCLFVKDIEKKSIDSDKSIAYFRELLEASNVSVNEIIPLRVLRTEFKPYEAQRNLCHSHNLFLADERIGGRLLNHIGKEFWKTKKLPIGVNMQAQDLTKEFQKVLQHAFYYTNGKGSLSTLHIANTSQSPSEIIANVEAAVSFFCKRVPGGKDNIRTIHLKTSSTLSVPIYLSLASPNDIKLEVPVKKRPHVEAEELTTQQNTKVKVYLDGTVKVIKEKTIHNELDEASDDEREHRQLIGKKRKFGFRSKIQNRRRKQLKKL